MLGVLVDTKADCEVQHLQDDERYDERVAEGRTDSRELPQELASIVVDQAGAATNGGDGKDTSGKRAPGASYAVYADNVERVVKAKADAKLDSTVAEQPGAHSNGQGRHDIHEACRRRDGNEARDCAGCYSYCARLAREHPAQHRPRDHCGGRGDEGGRERVGGAAAGGQRAAGVEAEPAKPQDGGSQEHEWDVVRLHGLPTVAKAPSVQQGGDERRSAGIDVHHGAAGEV